MQCKCGKKMNTIYAKDYVLFTCICGLLAISYDFSNDAEFYQPYKEKDNYELCEEDFNQLLERIENPQVNIKLQEAFFNRIVEK